METLLEVTLEVFGNNEISTSDVEWVGSSDGNYAITWLRFTQIAEFEFDYSSWGDVRLPCDLVIVAKDWWLEWDGEEGDIDGNTYGWRFRQHPVKQPDSIPFNKLATALPYRTIWHLNSEFQRVKS